MIEVAASRNLYVYLQSVSSLDFVNASVKEDGLRFVEWSKDGAKREICCMCVCKKAEFLLVLLVAIYTKALSLILMVLKYGLSHEA